MQWDDSSNGEFMRDIEVKRTVVEHYHGTWAEELKRENRFSECINLGFLQWDREHYNPVPVKK
jgi:hypothetical protein